MSQQKSAYVARLKGLYELTKSTPRARKLSTNKACRSAHKNKNAKLSQKKLELTSKINYAPLRMVPVP
jgi:hypothetical protein